MHKRLLVVADLLFPYNGITKTLYEVLPRLKDFDVTLLYPEKGKKFNVERVHEVIIPYNIRFVGLPIIKFGRKERELVEKAVAEADIVWVQFISPLSMLAINYAKKHNKKTVAFLNIFEEELFAANVFALLKPLKPAIRKVANSFYNKCDLVIAPSKNVRDEAKRRGTRVKFRIVPLGVDSKKITMTKEKAREIVGIEKDRFVVAYVGRLSGEKNIDTLLKAYEKFKEMHENASLLLVSYGKKSEMKKIRKLKDVKITGYVNKTLPYLVASDIFILPSSTETTSLATLEAMSAGLPVIVTRVGYIVRYVRNMHNGLFFEINDVDDLVKKMLLLCENETLRAELKKNAMKTARNFRWSRTTRALESIFISLLHEKRR